MRRCAIQRQAGAHLAGRVEKAKAGVPQVRRHEEHLAHSWADAVATAKELAQGRRPQVNASSVLSSCGCFWSDLLRFALHGNVRRRLRQAKARVFRLELQQEGVGLRAKLDEGTGAFDYEPRVGGARRPFWWV